MHHFKASDRTADTSEGFKAEHGMSDPFSSSVVF
jgi:hypothetical protein